MPPSTNGLSPLTNGGFTVNKRAGCPGWLRSKRKIQIGVTVNKRAGVTVDSSHARAGDGDDTGPNPTDRRKLGTKHQLLTDAQGIPLATTITGSNVLDVNELLPLVDTVPEVAGKMRRACNMLKQV